MWSLNSVLLKKDHLTFNCATEKAITLWFVILWTLLYEHNPDAGEHDQET